MSDRGHAGRLLFKAALKRVNSASPLGPSRLISSIFSSAFAFLASEEERLSSPEWPSALLVWVVFSWQTASSVYAVTEFAIRKMDVHEYRTSIKYYDLHLVII